METKKNMLYLECNSGISGDMTVAALLDLGADRNVLKEALKSIPVRGFRIKISRVKKVGLDVCDFHVILDEEHENHDHDMEYLFGEDHGGAHRGENHHGAEEQHGETKRHDGYSLRGERQCRGEELHGEDGHHDDGHEHHHHAHAHRSLPEILHIIEHTDMTKRAKETAKHIFEILAEAEAKAHGVPENEVHFHEVGAVDSIVDIISAAVCLDDLGVTECIVSPLGEGTGMIRCQHGIMSVPVPAVLNIVSAHDLELSMTDQKGELVTPTGAAIAAAVRTRQNLPGRFRVVGTGMGGGKREYERPSILRAMLIEELSDTVNENDNAVENRENGPGADVIYKLETNIDDCSGEALGYVMDRLLEAGARDVFYTPVYMKKNRPAYQLNVICREAQMSRLEHIIFRETTTIGIRHQKMERTVLPRRSLEVLTELGNASVKECRLPEHGGVRYYPEYDSVAELCRSSGKSFREVYQLITEQCREIKPDHVRKTAKGLKVRKFWKRKYEDLT